MHYTHTTSRPWKGFAAIAVSGSLLLAGCTVSNIHNSKSISSIQSQSQAREVIRNGMSMSQVEAKLGRPSNRATFNSQTTWIYSAASAPLSRKNILSGGLTGVIIPDRKTVVVTFNSSKRVSRVDYSEQINS